MSRLVVRKGNGSGSKSDTLADGAQGRLPLVEPPAPLPATKAVRPDVYEAWQGEKQKLFHRTSQLYDSVMVFRRHHGGAKVRYAPGIRGHHIFPKLVKGRAYTAIARLDHCVMKTLDPIPAELLSLVTIPRGIKPTGEFWTWNNPKVSDKQVTFKVTFTTEPMDTP